MKIQNVVLVATAVAAAAFLAFELMKPEKSKSFLVSGAADALACAQKGDAPCLSKYQFPDEVASGWSQDNVKYVYDKIILPFWAAQTKVGATVTQELSSQGLAGQDYRLKNGEMYRRLFDMVGDEKTPRTLLTDDLRTTFIAMYVSEHGWGSNNDALLKGLLAGIEKYGDDLKARGITSFSTKDATSGVISKIAFHQAEVNIRAKLAAIQHGDTRIVGPRGESPGPS